MSKRHEHTWRKTADWDWGPGTIVFVCIPCRGLRVVHPKPEKPADLGYLKVGGNPYRDT